LSAVNERDDDGLFDLDVLRGWKEVRDDALAADHALPALGRLICRDDQGRVRREFGVHGPEVYVGRYHPQNGPVDIVLTGLDDHEIYRLSAPHVRIVMTERGDWSVRPMTPAAPTVLNGHVLVDTREQYTMHDGDTVKLGATEFAFRTTGVSYDDWLDAKKDILTNVDQTGLFLMRNGGICGPRQLAPDQERLVLGRSFPTRDELATGPWRTEQQPDWNLAGLREWERKFIGFRHAQLIYVDEQWFIEPISSRQRTFVNRMEVSSATPLMPGDEVGLGSVLFHFHDPADIRASTESHTAELPAVVNWREEHTDPRVEPIERQSSGTYAAVDRPGLDEESGVSSPPEDDTE
jgi:hypothetical protein